jgi:heme/copper-type cytochrome/quinol oxidase subunit 3
MNTDNNTNTNTVYPFLERDLDQDKDLEQNLENKLTSITINNNNNNNNNNNIKGILKKNNETNNGNKMFVILKIIMFTIIIMLTMPFIFCNLYYAYTDKSCVNIEAGHIDINLKTYLAVDGIFCAITLLIVIIVICLVNENININEKNKCLFNIFGKLTTLFGIAWTIVGAIIFWKLIDNNKCDKGVYNYVFAQLIIKFVCYLFRIMQNNSDSNKK